MRAKPRQGARCRHYDRIPSENIIKRNKSCTQGGNSEEIATGISTRVIVMLTDVAMLRDRIWPRAGLMSQRQAMA